MKKIFIAALMVLLSFGAFAQELKVLEFRADMTMTDAVKYPKEDANGVRCGLIRMGLVIPDAQFEGDIISSEYKDGEWWVYMMKGANWITIKTKKYLPLRYEFEPIESNVTYVMNIERPQIASIENNTVTTLFPVWDSKNRIGWIDNMGNVVIKKRSITKGALRQVGPFVNGYAIVTYIKEQKGKTEMRSGYVNTMGILTTPISFYSCENFSEGLAAVASEYGKCGYINEQGQFQISPQFYQAAPFSEGLAFVITDSVSGYIDRNGKFVFKFDVDERVRKSVSIERYKFGNGLGPACKNGLWGYINHHGDWEIEPMFDFAYSFKNGSAIVGSYREGSSSLPKRMSLINRQGDFLVYNAQDLTYIHEGLASYKMYKGSDIMFVDTNGVRHEIKADDSLQIYGYPTWYFEDDHLDTDNDLIFSEGLASVLLPDEKGKYCYGFIDKTGKIVINARFRRAGYFKDGVAVVELKNGKKAYINKEGIPIYLFE